MEDEDAEEHCSNSPDASPNRVSDADWDGLSGFGKKDGTQHVEESEACYPSPEFCAIDKFSFTEAKCESCFTEACNYENQPVHGFLFSRFPKFNATGFVILDVDELAQAFIFGHIINKFHAIRA